MVPTNSILVLSLLCFQRTLANMINMCDFLWDVGPVLSFSHLQAPTENTPPQLPFSLGFSFWGRKQSSVWVQNVWTCHCVFAKVGIFHLSLQKHISMLPLCTGKSIKAHIGQAKHTFSQTRPYSVYFHNQEGGSDWYWEQWRLP